MFVWGEKPSRTWATPRRYVVVPFCVLIGRALISAIVSGLPFMETWYWSEPILAVPEGRIRFWTLIAFTTSTGVSLLACMAAVSISTASTRCLPPYGKGTEELGIVVVSGR